MVSIISRYVAILFVHLCVLYTDPLMRVLTVLPNMDVNEFRRVRLFVCENEHAEPTGANMSSPGLVSRKCLSIWNLKYILMFNVRSRRMPGVLKLRNERKNYSLPAISMNTHLTKPPKSYHLLKGCQRVRDLQRNGLKRSAWSLHE